MTASPGAQDRRFGGKALVLLIILGVLILGGRVVVRFVYRRLTLGPRLDAALRAADLPRAERLVAAGADVNRQLASGNYSGTPSQTILGVAIWMRDTACVIRLIRRGANVNQRWDTGITPLMFASSTGDPGIVRALLGAGARVNNRDQVGQTALMYATGFGSSHYIYGRREFRSPEVVQQLLAAGAEPNLEDQHGNTALAHAELGGERLVAAALRKVGAKGLREKLSGTPDAELFYAVRTQDVASVKLLLREGGRVTVQDREGMTPLMYAVTQEDGTILRHLLRHALDVRIALGLKNASGLTAIDYALGYENNLVQLLQAGADPNSSRKEILQMASPTERKLLLKAGARPR